MFCNCWVWTVYLAERLFSSLAQDIKEWEGIGGGKGKEEKIKQSRVAMLGHRGLFSSRAVWKISIWLSFETRNASRVTLAQRSATRPLRQFRYCCAKRRSIYRLVGGALHSWKRKRERQRERAREKEEIRVTSSHRKGTLKWRRGGQRITKWDETRNEGHWFREVSRTESQYAYIS